MSGARPTAAGLEKHATRTPSSESTVSGSSSSASSSDDSSQSSVSSSSSSASSGSPQALASPKAPATTVRPAGGSSSQWRMRQNPKLVFTVPDNLLIPLPRLQQASQVHTVLQRITGDKQTYPEGQYRSLDYFRAAVEMFVDTVRGEFAHQQKNAAKNGRPMTRFTWKNDGELAVCFACCCDWLKLLYGKLEAGVQRPLFDNIVGQLKAMLIGLSRIPVEILPRNTYDTKYRDWEKGGTRYHSGQSSANVRFPSAQDRQKKIEAYLSSSAGYRIDPVRVEPSVPVVPTAAPSAPGPTSSTPTGAPAAGPTATAVPPFVPPFVPAKGPPPQRHVSIAPRGPASMKALPARARQPPAQTAVKAVPEEMRHLYWLSALAHVKGGEPGAAFPQERVAALPGLVRLCNMTELASEAATLVEVVAQSTEAVQTVFERLGGLVAFRRMLGVVIRQSTTTSYHAVLRFLERVVRLQMPQWGTSSQRAWRMNEEGKVTDDLGWLRALPIIPVERRAAWGALLMVVEEKFLFRHSREETEEARKRGRVEAPTDAGTVGSVRAALADNVDIQHWRLPRVYTLSAVRLPTDLRAPPFASEVEEDSIAFMNKKRKFAEETQVEWAERIQAVLKTSAPLGGGDNVIVPVWYDPYQLLGIDPIV